MSDRSGGCDHGWVAVACLLLACGSSDNNASTSAKRGVAAPATSSTNGVLGSSTSGTSAVAPPVGTRGSGGSGLGPAPGAGVAGATNTMPPPVMMIGGGGVPGGGAAPGQGGAPPDPNTPFTGPVDGDPNKPMVSIPGIQCGVPNIGFGGTLPTVKITNRDVLVAYPCAHEGAAVTFFLFLHGTVDEPIKVTFTMNAWPIHQLVDSHNLIVVAPKAITTQWGNGDNGQDLPHLYDVVDWVYTTFGDKFNIRSMWAQGGSWGAFYLATTFACDPKFQDRLKGVQLVVGPGCPTCSNRLSCMVAQQELQLGNGMMLTDAQRDMVSSQANIDPYAQMHGCGMKTGPTAVGNSQYWVWPDCKPGWQHSYYLGPGQHADAWDPAVVLKSTEELKGTEQ